MIEVEIQKLTAAIEALTKAVQESARPTVVVNSATPTNSDNLQQSSTGIDDEVRQRLQAERAAAIKNLSEESGFETVDIEEVKKAVKDAEKRDQELLDLYKNEVAKTKRKAKVTKEETDALVEASKLSLSEVPISMGGSGAAPDDKALAPVSDLTENDLKTLAMEIARADSSARPIILSILGEHGAKTITQLDPKHYRAVHGRFMSLAHDIAKNGEEV